MGSGQRPRSSLLAVRRAPVRAGRGPPRCGDGDEGGVDRALRTVSAYRGWPGLVPVVPPEVALERRRNGRAARHSSAREHVAVPGPGYRAAGWAAAPPGGGGVRAARLGAPRRSGAHREGGRGMRRARGCRWLWAGVSTRRPRLRFLAHGCRRALDIGGSAAALVVSRRR